MGGGGRGKGFGVVLTQKTEASSFSHTEEGGGRKKIPSFKKPRGVGGGGVPPKVSNP